MKKNMHFVVAVVVNIVLAGCASTPKEGPTAIKTFADANTEASTAVANAFQLVNQAHYSAQSTSFLRDFETATQPPEFKRFLSQESIDVRANVFSQLSVYSALLVDLSGEKPLANLDKATDDLGKQLNGFKIDGKESLTSPEISAGIATSLNGIGRSIIEKRRTEGIAQVAKEADPRVQNICALLLQDIANLQSQLRIENTKITDDYFQYLRENIVVQPKTVGSPKVAALNPIQKRDEIEKIGKLASQGMYSEDFLAQLVPMIKALGAVHSAIANEYGESATSRQMAANFYQEVRRVRQMYFDLRKKLEGE